MTAVSLVNKRINESNVQWCPLCNSPQEKFVKGTEYDSSGMVRFVDGKGYSFCNCHNIFFTDWSNIEKQCYSEEYYTKYQCPEVELTHKAKAKHFIPIIAEALGKKSGLFLDVGSINDHFLDEAKRIGFEAIGMDTFKHPSKHGQIVSDFEMFHAPEEEFDVIWATHVFEHFRYPLQQIDKCYKMLKKSGILYVEMPDPWFIPWGNPNLWSHWHVKEHHTLWDMDSFVDCLLKAGFEYISATRTIGEESYTLSGDMQIMVRK